MRTLQRALLAAALASVLAQAPLLRAVTPQLVWNDEFYQPDNSAPDSTKWGYDLGVGNPVGWGNNELETYTNSRDNSLVVSDPDATDGKALAIRAQSSNGSYTSARIQTGSTFSFKYGRLEARAKVPKGAGVWPGFWALGGNIGTVEWPACGEIDVMENVGQTPDSISGSLHAPGYSGGSALTAQSVLSGGQAYGDAYHVFAVDWYPDRIIWSVDGVVYEVQTEAGIPAGASWPFVQNFFVILDFAVGGNWPGPPNANTIFPQDYRVDYVRVYSLPTTPPPSLVWAPSPPLNPSAYFSGATRVSVSWKPPFSVFGASVTGYQLERATDAAFTQNLTSWTLGTATSYTDSSVGAGGTYYYRVHAVSLNGTSDPSAGVQATALAPTVDSKLLNISTRGFVGNGTNELIAGFLVGGSTTKNVLIRASGPALEKLNILGALPDPMLQVYSGSTVIATNSGWAGDPAIASAASAAGGFSWLDPTSKDSALLMSLSPGLYTAEVSGASGDTGVSLVEVYDVTSAGDTSKLLNISTRGFVGTGSSSLIAGFFVGGSTAKTVLIRASGPALDPFGVSGTLPDPQLQIYTGSTLLASNDAWAGNPAIASAANAAGGFPWSDPTSSDAALLLTLDPGAYTAVVSGVNADTGVSLVEVYDVP